MNLLYISFWNGGIMKKLSKWITNNSLLIIIISLLLLIPSIIGYVHTKVNYDLLVYLPENIDTIKGQNIMTDEFGVGAFAFVTADYKNNTEIKALEEQFKYSCIIFESDILRFKFDITQFKPNVAYEIKFIDLMPLYNEWYYKYDKVFLNLMKKIKQFLYVN